MPLWVYLLLFVYPGASLTLLRSYLEHRAHDEVDARTIIVEAGPVMSLLYLNNNLHAAHHDEPGLAWYRAAGRYRQHRDSCSPPTAAIGLRLRRLADATARRQGERGPPAAWP